ncbi:MAG: hypothetical protein IPG90_18765 [Bacteroidetes bacterium]|nr:hypothetical protein [Bacteroidota bacterium]
MAEYGNLLNVPLNQWPFNLHPPVQTLFEQLNIISQHLINYTGIFNTFPEIHCNITPLELHPYIDLYPIDINRRLLFIGTFPPFSYIHQNLNNTGLERLMNIYNRPIENIIPWFLYFYGNDNSLWRYLPGIENVEQLDVNFIQNWNLIYDVSFTDIIRSCQRSRFQSTDDKDLYNIIFNSKVFESLLNPKSNIDKLYFTSGKWQAQILNGNAKLNALKLFLKASMEAGIMVNVASWNQPEQMHFLEVHDELLDGKALFASN